MDEKKESLFAMIEVILRSLSESENDKEVDESKSFQRITVNNSEITRKMLRKIQQRLFIKDNNSSLYRCDICDYTNKKMGQTMVHVNMHIQGLRFHCSCKFIGTAVVTMKQHYRLYHSDSAYKTLS